MPQRYLFLQARLSKLCNNFRSQMAILTEFCVLHFSFKWKHIRPKNICSFFFVIS